MGAECAGEGACHGSLSWRDECGSVKYVCDMPFRTCCVHGAGGARWDAFKEQVSEVRIFREGRLVFSGFWRVW